MNSSGESAAREQWPSIEFEKEAHRLAREDERGKLLSQCQREIVHEQGLDETGGPSCECCELAHPLILIHAATRAMERYAARAREEWIPVSARLPDFHERVLAIINGRGINVVNRRPGFKKGWLWSMGYATIKQTAVTHWCRIPAAPFAAKGEPE